MPGRVAVVTDSTAYLPVEVVVEHRLTVVPLQVAIGGRVLAEGDEVTSAEVAEALRAHRPVTTSRPSPQAFAEIYARLWAGGLDGIVSIHLSGDLSGTVEAARTAARTVAADGIRVEVVDSRSLAMGLGFVALAAATSAAGGASPAEVGQAARRQVHRVGVWLYVDTLEYLHRGGRIGSAAAMVGSALAVKPLLHVLDGRLEPLDRVRTASRALTRLEEVVVAEAGGAVVDLAVQHLAAAERAEELAGRLRDRLPAARSVRIVEVGAVLGAHVGPGMLGVVLSFA